MPESARQGPRVSLVIAGAITTLLALGALAVGAKVAYLAAVGWSSVGVGLALLAGAAGLFTLSGRPPRRRRGASQPAPAAA